MITLYFFLPWCIFALAVATTNNQGVSGHECSITIKVCRGSSKVILSPPEGWPIHDSRKVKFKSRINGSQFIDIQENITHNNGTKKYDRNGVNALIVWNPTDADIGTYQYVKSHKKEPFLATKCQVSFLFKNCEILRKSSGSNITLTCRVKGNGNAELKKETEWRFTGLYDSKLRYLTDKDGNIKDTDYTKLFSGGLKVSPRTLTIINLKKNYSGFYVCIVYSTLGWRKTYGFNLTVKEPAPSTSTPTTKGTLPAVLSTIVSTKKQSITGQKTTNLTEQKTTSVTTPIREENSTIVVLGKESFATKVKGAFSAVWFLSLLCVWTINYDY